MDTVQVEHTADKIITKKRSSSSKKTSPNRKVIINDTTHSQPITIAVPAPHTTLAPHQPTGPRPPRHVTRVGIVKRNPHPPPKKTNSATRKRQEVTAARTENNSSLQNIDANSELPSSITAKSASISHSEVHIKQPGALRHSSSHIIHVDSEGSSSSNELQKASLRLSTSVSESQVVRRSSRMSQAASESPKRHHSLSSSRKSSKRLSYSVDFENKQNEKSFRHKLVEIREEEDENRKLIIKEEGKTRRHMKIQANGAEEAIEDYNLSQLKQVLIKQESEIRNEVSQLEQKTRTELVELEEIQNRKAKDLELARKQMESDEQFEITDKERKWRMQDMLQEQEEWQIITSQHRKVKLLLQRWLNETKYLASKVEEDESQDRQSIHYREQILRDEIVSKEPEFNRRSKVKEIKRKELEWKNTTDRNHKRDIETLITLESDTRTIILDKNLDDWKILQQEMEASILSSKQKLRDRLSREANERAQLQVSETRVRATLEEDYKGMWYVLRQMEQDDRHVILAKYQVASSIISWLEMENKKREELSLQEVKSRNQIIDLARRKEYKLIVKSSNEELKKRWLERRKQERFDLDNEEWENRGTVSKNERRDWLQLLRKERLHKCEVDEYLYRSDILDQYYAHYMLIRTLMMEDKVHMIDRSKLVSQQVQMIVDEGVGRFKIQASEDDAFFSIYDKRRRIISDENRSHITYGNPRLD